jgi:hypothetical protein
MKNKSNHEYKVYSNTLYILESLVDEQKTGKWLYDDLIPITYTNDTYSIKYIPFESLNHFFTELDKIKKEIKENKKMPTIHLEAHGNQNGFEIAQTKEFVSWNELNDKLAEINFLCRNNLILSLGVCYGHYISLDMILRFQNNKRCPFIVNISPQAKIKPQEIMYGFSNFYKALFEHKVFYNAMEEMKYETKLNFILTADTIAKQLIELFLTDLTKNNQFSFKTSVQLQELIRNGKNPYPDLKFNQALKALKRYKRQHYKSAMEKRWNLFLMLDTYDENKRRFENFEELWK